MIRTVNPFIDPDPTGLTLEARGRRVIAAQPFTHLLDDRTKEDTAPDCGIILRAETVKGIYSVPSIYAGVPFTSQLETDRIGVEFKTRGHYTQENWPGFGFAEIAEEMQFILDEKTGIELLWSTDPTGMIVEAPNRYYAFSQYDLTNMFRMRGYRKLGPDEVPTEDDKKAKWLLTLEDGVRVPSIEEGVRYILRESCLTLKHSITARRTYYGEVLLKMGVERTKEHRAIDRQQISK